MASREKYTPKKQGEIKTVPFENAQEAWFWFVQAQAARFLGEALGVPSDLIRKELPAVQGGANA